jgi:hypothetical protein
MAEVGMTEEDLREMVRKLESPARDVSIHVQSLFDPSLHHRALPRASPAS